MTNTRRDRHKTIAIAALFVAFLAIPLFFLKNPTSLDDGLRHMVYATTLRAEGIFAVPGWSRFIYAGTMGQLEVDPWFLSDVLMIPLTVFPPLIALKLLILIQAAFVLFSAALLIRSFRLPHALVPLYLFFFLFGNHLFLSRLMLGRPFPVMTGMFVLTLYAILEKRWKTLAILLCVSVLLSHLFVFPLGIALFAAAWMILIHRKKDAMRALSASAMGTAAGFLLHPQAHDYAVYLLTIFFKIPFLRELGLGKELGYGFHEGFSSVVLATLILVTLMSVYFFKTLERRRDDARTALFLGVLCIGGLVGQILWIRAVDFLWPVLIICIAYFHSRDPHLFARACSLLLPPSFKPMLMTDILILATIVQALAVGFFLYTGDAKKSLAPYGAIDAVKPGARVLNVSWDSFPPFLWRRPDLHFATGMDPTFLYVDHPAAYGLLKTFDRGQVGAKNELTADAWVRTLQATIPSDVLAVRNANVLMIDRLEKVESLRLLSNTGSFAIFEWK